MKYSTKALAFLAAFTAVAGTSGLSLADPPPWAERHYGHSYYPYRHYHGGGDVVVVGAPPIYGAPAYPYAPSAPYVQVQCGPRPITGTVIGGVTGGLIGTQFGHGGGHVASIVGGSLLGAALGAQVDAQNANCFAQSFEYARPNTQVVWQDQGQAYSVLPTDTYRDNSGRYCREYQARVNVGGQIQQSYGTACRQPDGTWQIMN